MNIFVFNLLSKFLKHIKMGKYVKLTKKDSDEYHVVLATNEAFYKSQGWEVSDPSKKEIEKFFPEESKEKPAKDGSALEISKLQSLLDTEKSESLKKDGVIKELQEELTKLKGKQ